jgi:predicted nucleic acid-binding protein
LKILLDTNIVLDLLLKREPFCDDALEVFSFIETQEAKGYLCATTITTIYYLISKQLNKSKADKVIEDILQLFNIADVNKDVLKDSIKNNGKDFEDSVIYTSAKYSQIDIIISRDKKGFTKSEILTLEPKEFLASLL